MPLKRAQETRTSRLAQETCTSDIQHKFFFYKLLALDRTQLYSMQETWIKIWCKICAQVSCTNFLSMSEV